MLVAAALVVVVAVCASASASAPAAASSRRSVRIVARLRNSYPNFTRLEADCPTGYTLTSGGAEALGTRSILNASIPNASHTGWIAVGHQPGFDSVGLHVFAVCLENEVVATAQLSVVARIRPSYPNFTRLEARCPRGATFGGGAEALGGGSNLNASIPDRSGAGWIAVGNQPDGDSVGLHAFAVCAAPSDGLG